MSVSLYYEAERTWPITPQEQAACNEIADRYNSQYPFGELYESFCIYDPTESPSPADGQPIVIFSGATKLPPAEDMDLIFNVLHWWLKCLREIADVLTDAQWRVHVDGAAIEWDDIVNIS